MGRKRGDEVSQPHLKTLDVKRSRGRSSDRRDIGQNYPPGPPTSVRSLYYFRIKRRETERGRETGDKRKDRTTKIVLETFNIFKESFGSETYHGGRGDRVLLGKRDPEPYSRGKNKQTNE